MWPELASNGYWKTTSLGTPTSSSYGLVAPTSTTPQILTLNTGTASGAGIQAQSGDGASTVAAFARVFARATNIIHLYSRFQISNVNLGFLIGLTEINTAVIAANSTLGATDGIFLYKANGATDINLIVRRGGVSNSTTALQLAAAVDTNWHSFGFRFDTTWGELWLDDVRIAGIDLSGGTYAPNAALALSVAAVTNAAAARTLNLQGLCAFQEAR
jgi:hypothetical protein